MTVDAHLLELLQQWLAWRRQGKVVAPEEMCADSPELLPQFRNLIQEYTVAQSHPTQGIEPAEAASQRGSSGRCPG